MSDDTVPCTSLRYADAVDAALASALEAATAAGRWDAVVQVARELEARRAARPEAGPVNIAKSNADRRN